MFAQERHSLILQALERDGSVRVASLARELQVTEETVRRDLERLGHDGRLLRTHGGALPLDNSSRRELPFAVRSTAQLMEKRAIASNALSHIIEGDVIAIDGSSSGYCLACSLPDIPLTVITPSVPVVAALADKSHVRVVCLGGYLDSTSMSFSGPLMEFAVQQFNIHKLFISCKGLDIERGLSETTDSLAAVKKCLIARADRTYLLADHTKFSVRSTVVFAALSDVDVIITDQNTAPDLLRGFAAAGPAIFNAA
jgi:DeoR family transcriptional regulator, L-fucose operon activator